ncbi:S24 family peptidase [Microbulbifer sp. ANSA003]|uniref:S24 family peptidase n=1 Tax=Microbulbifer sp. ANSA003 TaxID=3243360 RepID=UPI004042C9D2
MEKKRSEESKVKGAKFEELARNAGIKWADLARQLGVNPQTITHWRKRGVAAAHSVRVAQMLDCKPTDISWIAESIADSTIEVIRRNNLNLLAEKHGRATLSQTLEYPDNNYLNQLCTGHTNIGSRTARKVEGALGLKSGWMDYPQSLERYAPEPKNFTQGPDIKGRIPLISWVQAGKFCEAMDLLEPCDAEEWLPCPTAHSDRAYALRIKGDSMASPYPGQRSYPEGIIIFVDPEKPVTNGSRVIARLNGEATFKTFAEDMGRLFLRPINPSYPTMDITDLDVTFCGVIIGSYYPE